MTTVHTVKGTPLAFGLKWRVLQLAEGGDTSAEVLAMIGSANNSRYGVRLVGGDASRQQYFVGFVQTPVPRSIGKAVSAAAWLAARSVGQQTLFVGEIAPDQTWVALINADGVIDSETDIVVSTDEAHALVDRVLQRVLVDASVVPVSVIVSAGYPVSSIQLLRDGVVPYATQSLSEILTGPVPTVARVRLLNGVSRSTWITLASIVFLFLLGAGAWAAWSTYEARKAREAAAAAALAAAQQELQVRTDRERNMETAVTAELLKDTATPRPSALLQACISVVERIGFQVAGWDVRDVTCDPAGNVKIAWQLARGVGSTTAVLESAVRDVLDAAVAVDARPEIAVTAIKRAGGETLLSVRPGLTRKELPPSRELFRSAGGVLQEFTFAHSARSNVTVPVTKSIRFEDPTVSDPKKRWAEVPPERSYKSGTASVSGNTLWEWEAAASLFDAPVYTIKNIKVRPSKEGRFQWTVEVIYVVSNA